MAQFLKKVHLAGIVYCTNVIERDLNRKKEFYLVQIRNHLERLADDEHDGDGDQHDAELVLLSLLLEASHLVHVVVRVAVDQDARASAAAGRMGPGPSTTNAGTIKAAAIWRNGRAFSFVKIPFINCTHCRPLPIANRWSQIKKLQEREGISKKK